MKKVLSVLMVVAAMMFATNANAQIKFGLKGGLDVTNMSLSNDVFDASNKTGFFVGPMVKVIEPQRFVDLVKERIERQIVLMRQRS